MKVNPDSPQIAFPPPLLLLGSIAAGIGLQFFIPLPFVSGLLRWLLGAGLCAAGIVITASCIACYHRASTAIEPWRKTKAIVTNGPNRWSRNPIYLSFILVGLGTAVLLNNLWIALLQLPLLLLLQEWVIRREERYLQGKFGEEYLGYARKVRRWL